MIRRPWSTLFIDAILNIVLLLMLIVNPPQKADASPPRAVYTLTVVWDFTPHKLDIDIYVRTPAGSTMFFRNKDLGLVFMDRDHLGVDSINGTVRREDVQWVAPVEAGSYLVSIHNYHGSSAGTVSLELRDGKGLLRWSTRVDCPAPQAETPIAELTFGPDGKLLSVRPSATYIVRMATARASR